jgi:hypothetical protein
MFLDSFVLKQSSPGNRGKFWLLMWQQKGWVKGGQVYVRVYMDGKVENTLESSSLMPANPVID